MLDRLLEDVRTGHSSVLVIRGEAGVGKTTLLRCATEAASDFRVAQIAGIESEMELAYAGLHQLCTPMLDRLDAIAQPQQLALSVALGLISGDPPDRLLVALATLGLKVFMKLGISSRKGLPDALPARGNAVAVA